ADSSRRPAVGARPVLAVDVHARRLEARLHRRADRASRCVRGSTGGLGLVASMLRRIRHALTQPVRSVLPANRSEMRRRQDELAALLGRLHSARIAELPDKAPLANAEL